MNHRCCAQACQWMPQTFRTKLSAILFRNTNRRWYRLLVWILKSHFSMCINASFTAIHWNGSPFWSWQTDVKMLLTDKLEYISCTETVENPREQRERERHSVLTTLPWGILGFQAFKTVWAAEASCQLKNLGGRGLSWGYFLPLPQKSTASFSSTSPKWGKSKPIALSLLFPT